MWFVTNDMLPQPSAFPVQHLAAEYAQRRQERHARYSRNCWNVNDMRGYAYSIHIPKSYIDAQNKTGCRYRRRRSTVH